MRAALLLPVALCGCMPDHGVRLTYSTGAESYAVASKRLDAVRAKYKLERSGNGLVLTLPGATPQTVSDVKELLSTPATLEFSLVVEGLARPHDREAPLPEGVSLVSDSYSKSPSNHLQGPTQEAVRTAVERFDFPPGRVLISPEGDRFRSWVLEAQPLLTNDAIDDAEANTDGAGQAEVDLTFTKAQAETFAKATGEHVGRQLAIMLDGRVESAPTILEKIRGGHARITMGRGSPGHDPLKEAQALASKLKGGAMPVVPVLASEEAYASK